jgi:hypothetical protein
MTAAAFNPKDFVRRTKEQMQALEITEDGLALAFAERYRKQLRYCHHQGAWFLWDGQRWPATVSRETPVSKRCSSSTARAGTERASSST